LRTLEEVSSMLNATPPVPAPVLAERCQRSGSIDSTGSSRGVPARSLFSQAGERTPAQPPSFDSSHAQTFSSLSSPISSPARGLGVGASLARIHVPVVFDAVVERTKDPHDLVT
jgi:hypothetical protein